MCLSASGGAGLGVSRPVPPENKTVRGLLYFAPAGLLGFLTSLPGPPLVGLASTQAEI